MRCRKAILALVLLGLQAGQAQQPVTTHREANQRIGELTAALPSRPADYLIGGGDLLRIDVFDVPELSRAVRVSESGHISLPLIPVKVRAAGLSAFQLEEKLAELLQVNQLVSHPQVTVFIQEHRSQPITIIGAVNQPTTLQAIRHITLLEALSEAGGLADNAGSVVIVTRPASLPASSEESGEADGESAGGPQTITIGLRDLVESGDPRFNIPVFGGDVISVSRPGIIYVVGAVHRSGGFVLKSDSEEMTALKALALAQGLKGTAKPARAAIIRKDPDTGETQEIDVNLKKIMARKAGDVRLYADDILFVPDSGGKKALRRAAEAGIAITTGLLIIRR